MEILFGLIVMIIPLIVPAVIIYGIVQAIKGAAKNQGYNNNPSAPSLDDIFNEASRAGANRSGSSDEHNGGFSAYIKSVDNKYPRGYTPSQTAKKPIKKEKAPSRESLITPTVHTDNDHDCEEINYDQIDSLMGKDTSLNLAGDVETSKVDAYDSDRKISIGREDLLKSFIMSEVLQRYDINRVYSRIPSMKPDDR